MTHPLSIIGNQAKRITYPLREQMRRSFRILRSPYASLILDSRLETRLAAKPAPPVKVLAQDEEYVYLEVEGLRLWWPKIHPFRAVPSLYKEIFGAADWNPHAYEFGGVRIEKDSWVVDAGSCEGFFIHYALKCGAKVVAVEPVPMLARALERTFAADIAAQRVRIIQGALGRNTGTFGLEIPHEMVYCASLAHTGGSSVPVYTLDELFENGTIPDVDFVKMDIEGGEIDAIHGARSLLRVRQPKLSIAVYHAECNARLLKEFILNTAPDYEVKWRGLWVRGDDAPRPYMLHASPAK